MGRVRSTWAARLLAAAALLQAGAALWFLVVMEGDLAAANASFTATFDGAASIGSEPPARTMLQRMSNGTFRHRAAGEVLFRAGLYDRATEQFLLAGYSDPLARLGVAKSELSCGRGSRLMNGVLAKLYYGPMHNAVVAYWLARSLDALGERVLSEAADREAIALADDHPDARVAAHAAEARLARGWPLGPVPDGCHSTRPLLDPFPREARDDPDEIARLGLEMRWSGERLEQLLQRLGRH